MKIFDLDNPFIGKLQTMTDIIFAGLLWLLFSVPLITVGAATAAMYYTIVKVVRHKRETIWNAFWHSFKSNFKISIPITLLYGAELFLLYIYVRYMKAGLETMNALYIVAGVVLLISCVGTLPYIFPIVSRFDAGISKQLRYALSMSATHPLITIVLVIILTASCIAVFAVPFLLLIVPGISTYLMSFLIEIVFRKCTKSQINNKEDLPWYLE